MILPSPHGPIQVDIRPSSHTDVAVIKEIWDENVYKVRNDMLNDGGTILDIGANIGIFTLDILSRAKQEDISLTIYAIEPEANNIKLLKKNLEYNKKLLGKSSVILVNKAIGDRVSLVNISNNFGDSRISETGQEVEMTTIDELFSQNNIESVDFAKFDIEGYEPATILAASKQNIDKIKYTAIEFDEQSTIDEFTELMRLYARKCSISTLGVPKRGCYIYTERHI